MSLKFTVLGAEWVADGESFSANGNPHELEDPSPGLARLAGSAHHAGDIEVHEGLVDDHVMSQEETEAALAAAMGDFVPPEVMPDGTTAPGYWTGPWAETAREQAEADALARAEAGMVVDVTPQDVASIESVMGGEQ